MPGHPVASIIIRAKNEEVLIGEVLTAVYEQTFTNSEVILVDSGSTDRTLTIARMFPLKIIEIQPREFTYGMALNIGCKAARGEFLIFLSAHAVPLTTNWLARLLKHFHDPNVAAVWGGGTGRKTFRPKQRVVRQNLRMFMSDYYFGLSNANAAVRTHLWRLHPFNELLPYTEDKEWAWRVLREGYTVVFDSSALVWHYHNDTFRQVWRRAHLEHVGFAYFLDLSVPSGYEVFRRVCEQAVLVWKCGATRREAPWQSGYSCNLNIYSEVSCSPCWLRNTCPHERLCMRIISASDVVDAVHAHLDKARGPLTIDTLQI